MTIQNDQCQQVNLNPPNHVHGLKVSFYGWWIPLAEHFSHWKKIWSFSIWLAWWSRLRGMRMSLQVVVANINFHPSLPLYTYQDHLTFPWSRSFKLNLTNVILAHPIVLQWMFSDFYAKKHTHLKRRLFPSNITTTKTCSPPSMRNLKNNKILNAPPPPP